MKTQFKRVLRGYPRRAVFVCLLVAGVLMIMAPVLSAEPPGNTSVKHRCIRAATDPWGETTRPLPEIVQECSSSKSNDIGSFIRIIPYIYVPNVPGVVIFKNTNSSEISDANRPQTTIRTGGKAASRR